MQLLINVGTRAMTKFFCFSKTIATDTLTSSLATCSRYYRTQQLSEDILKSIDKCKGYSDDKGWFFLLLLLFSKNSHIYLDFESSNLKVELARDIIITNIYVKFY